VLANESEGGGAVVVLCQDGKVRVVFPKSQHCLPI
jgi:hypothetical protein